QERLCALVKEIRGLSPNIATGVAALLLDDGQRPEDIGRIVTIFTENVFIAHAVEGAQQADARLQQLPDEHLEYVGVPPRVSPRAQRQTNLTSDAPSAVASARNSRSA